MAAEDRDWFEELTPPPGGADRLLARLEEAGRPRAILAPRIALAGMTIAALGLAVIFLTADREEGAGESQTGIEIAEAEAFDRLLGRPIGQGELVVAVDRQAVEVSALQSSNPRIRIYRVDPVSGDE